MNSDSENEFVDATDYFESDPVSSGGNSGLVLTNAYLNIKCVFISLRFALYILNTNTKISSDKVNNSNKRLVFAMRRTEY